MSGMSRARSRLSRKYRKCCLRNQLCYACSSNQFRRHGRPPQSQLSRGDYGMKFNQALGSGNVLVGDKVKLALDVSAVKAA